MSRFSSLVHATIGLIYLCSSALAAPQDDIEALVRAHEENKSKITTLDVTLTCEEKFPNTTDYLNSGTVRWVKNRDHQRFDERILIRPSSDKTVEHFNQTELGGDRGRSLRGWNPEHRLSTPLVPMNEPSAYWSVHGDIDSPTSNGLRRWAPELWLLFDVDVNRSLKEFLHTESVTAEMLPRNGTLHRLRLHDRKADKTIVCHLDEQHNWLIKKVELLDKDGVSSSREVKAFTEPTPGTFFPSVIETTTRRGFSVRITASGVKVNEPVTPTDLTLEFPEGCKVTDKTNGKIYIWGKNAPSLTFHDEKTFEAWEEKFLLEKYEQKSRNID
ncbi:hypothetical protein [Planctomicrobium sp. SH527]|uniref:hypothetical protein n=1 Tax=Planctomicrobium sp. SH527 TaxID=3448123 RepID=UPI003F5B08C2